MARIASEEPGPAQQYARQVRKWIAKLRERDRNVRIEFRWCPAHSGVAGNEEADKWAKQAAEEPDARGVKWMGYKDRYGRRLMPPPRSLANLKREISERKWEEAWTWSKKRVRGRKYQMPKTMHQNNDCSAKPEEASRKVPPTQGRALPHRAIPEVDEELRNGGVRMVPVQDADKGTPLQEL